jgi:hypothetical protein
MELGTFSQLLYPGMVIVGGRKQATRTWDHWALNPYTDQGTYQDGMVHMFWITLVDNFQILFALYFDMQI